MVDPRWPVSFEKAWSENLLMQYNDHSVDERWLWIPQYTAWAYIGESIDIIHQQNDHSWASWTISCWIFNVCENSKHTHSFITISGLN